MGKKVVSFKLPEELVEWLDKTAQELGMSRAQLIETIFSRGLGLVLVEVKAIKERQKQ